jgi:hypothetical protein
MKKVDFQPGDYIYQNSITKSAFDKRSLSSNITAPKNYWKLIVLQNKFYSIFWANKKLSYQSRSINHLQREKPPVRTLATPPQDDLPCDEKTILMDFELFLSTIVTNLNDNPNSLFEQAKVLERICNEEEIRIPPISAFESVGSWEEFIELLQSFKSKNDPNYFELVIALIIQYAKLCGG